MSKLARTIDIGGRLTGPGEPCFVIAEIGINHNGELPLARKLIAAAAIAGADAVKFQKRTVELAWRKEDLEKPRESPFGSKAEDLRRGLEFGFDEYQAIDEYCKLHGIPWFASCWDQPSADFVQQFEPPCWKISSASLTDDALLLHTRSLGRPVVLSTGMSSIDQIDHAVEVLGREDLLLLHSTSVYPASLDELNLSVISTLQDRYNVPVGYSGHEVGLATTVAAVAIGACVVERHLTLDRALWGSDQAASIEPAGFARLVRDIRAVEQAVGDGRKRVYPGELEKQHLRRFP